MNSYTSGYGFPREAIFDLERSRRLYTRKWFFVGTRGDVPKPRDYLKFSLFEDEYFLLHGTDGVIRCFANRCAHQSARLVRETTGRMPASIVCPNHQWAYRIDDGSLRAARGMGADFPQSPSGQCLGLSRIGLEEVEGMLFACLDPQADRADIEAIRTIVSPAAPFGLGKPGYKLAHHQCEVVDASWLIVMINNRECDHCQMNHRGLVNLFDPSSFNGTCSPGYDALFRAAVARWEAQGLEWREQAFDASDCCRVARYPMQEGFDTITFDGRLASKRLIGPFAGGKPDQSTLSMWFNPNVWVHFTSDHIATNWVLPLTGDSCALYTSWIVQEEAEEGEDYDLAHLTEVWNVTNAEDVELCRSMTAGARSAHYRPGPFAPNEQFCTQFCDWVMRHSG